MKTTKAFSIVEFMVVLAVVAIIAAIAIPNISSLNMPPSSVQLAEDTTQPGRLAYVERLRSPGATPDLWIVKDRKTGVEYLVTLGGVVRLEKGELR